MPFVSPTFGLLLFSVVENCKQNIKFSNQRCRLWPFIAKPFNFFNFWLFSHLGRGLWTISHVLAIFGHVPYFCLHLTCQAGKWVVVLILRLRKKRGNGDKKVNRKRGRGRTEIYKEGPDGSGLWKSYIYGQGIRGMSNRQEPGRRSRIFRQIIG